MTNEKPSPSPKPRPAPLAEGPTEEIPATAATVAIPAVTEEVLPAEWEQEEPAFVRWAATVAERPTWEKVPEPTDDDGSIFSSLYRELVVGEPPPLPPAQPSRPDLRKLTCLVCGQPASPHRVSHAVRVLIPARAVV